MFASQINKLVDAHPDPEVAAYSQREFVALTFLPPSKGMFREGYGVVLSVAEAETLAAELQTAISAAKAYDENQP